MDDSQTRSTVRASLETNWGRSLTAVVAAAMWAVTAAAGCDGGGETPGPTGATGDGGNVDAADGSLPPDSRSPAEDGVVEATYRSGGRPIELGIILGRIAVLTSRDVDESRVETFVSKFGLSLDSHEPYFSVARTDGVSSRGDLGDLLWKLRAEAPDAVRGIGMILAGPSGEGIRAVATDKFIAKFGEGVSRDQIDALNDSRGVRIDEPFPLSDNEFVLEVTEEAEGDVLEVANRYHDLDESRYAHPDFYQTVASRTTRLNDQHVSDQWHHRASQKTSNAPKDADVDTAEAWDRTTGDAAVTIAVIEVTGIDHDHEDLKANRFVNMQEKNGISGKDDDGDGYTDDVYGLDFGVSGDHDPHPVSKSYRAKLAIDPNHGTGVAGLAAAKGNNTKGVAGTCPDCTMLPIRMRKADCFSRRCLRVSRESMSINYASKNADIINNSWGHKCRRDSSGNLQCNWVGVTNSVRSAVRSAESDGDLVLFAGGNTPTEKFCTKNSYPSLTDVLAVSGSTRGDGKWNLGATGDCMDVLAPAEKLWTTDRTGSAGYSTGSSVGPNYYAGFNATSGATPIVAGIAGLVRSTNGSMSPQAMRRLFRDTADRIEPGKASYSAVNGQSDPGTGSATHAWGRANAREAVRVAQQGVDVFVRDHRLDWGNTEQPSGTKFSSKQHGFIPWWQSPDIKVDAPDGSGNFEPAPTNSSDFESLTGENPEADDKNRVYVRLRNRGPQAAQSVDVKLYYAFAGTGLPRFSRLNQIGTESVSTLPYSGASVAGSSSDAARVVQLEWDAPKISSNQKDPRHFCLVAVVESNNDSRSSISGPVSNLVPTDNNITLNNVELIRSLSGTSLERFYVRNPFDQSIDTILEADAPEGWTVELEQGAFGELRRLDAGSERLRKVRIEPEGDEPGTVQVRQLIVRDGPNRVVGGMTYRFGPDGSSGN